MVMHVKFSNNQINNSQDEDISNLPVTRESVRRRQWHPTPVLLPRKSNGWRSLVGSSPWGRKESDTIEWLHFHFHVLEKEMATHSSVLAWRIPGTGEPGGLPSMGSHRVGHDWSDLAAAAAESQLCIYPLVLYLKINHPHLYYSQYIFTCLFWGTFSRGEMYIEVSSWYMYMCISYIYDL